MINTEPVAIPTLRPNESHIGPVNKLPIMLPIVYIINMLHTGHGHQVLGSDTWGGREGGAGANSHAGGRAKFRVMEIVLVLLHCVDGTKYGLQVRELWTRLFW